MKTLRLLPIALLAVTGCATKSPAAATGTTPATPAAPAAAEPVEPNGVAEAPPEGTDAAAPEEMVQPSAAMDDPPADPAATAVASEQAAYEKAKPVFDKYCSKCHTSAGKKASQKKLAMFNMDSYPFGGKHADMIGEKVRDMLGVTPGKKAKMPKDDPGAVKGEELDLIVAWSKAFDEAHAAEPRAK